ncbi:hypothetical protein KW882_03725 [Vibrio parahaemolyticus]
MLYITLYVLVCLLWVPFTFRGVINKFSNNILVLPFIVSFVGSQLLPMIFGFEVNSLLDGAQGGVVSSLIAYVSVYWVGYLIAGSASVCLVFVVLKFEETESIGWTGKESFIWVLLTPFSLMFSVLMISVCIIGNSYVSSPFYEMRLNPHAIKSDSGIVASSLRYEHKESEETLSQAGDVVLSRCESANVVKESFGDGWVVSCSGSELKGSKLSRVFGEDKNSDVVRVVLRKSDDGDYLLRVYTRSGLAPESSEAGRDMLKVIFNSVDEEFDKAVSQIYWETYKKN